MLIDVIN